jgi:glycosyltransferase involved in cell wall biosynthesis
MEPVVSIIIPTYKRNKIANTCLESILNCDLNTIEIIVINDDKENKFSFDQKNAASNIKIIDNPKSGVASARNLGAKMANSSILIFIDDDMIITKGSIEKAINFLKTTEHATYNANWEYEKELVNTISKNQFGRYLVHINFTSLKGWNLDNIQWKENALIESNGITSQFWAITKNDFESIGGYNENFPFAGFEDHEISLKLKNKSITNYIDTSTTIYHNELDRLNPVNWLERKRKGAITRRVAVKLGHTDLQIHYSFFKKTILKTLVFIKPLLLNVLKIIPNFTLFDLVYFKIMNLLIAVNIYQGFNKD